MIKLNEDVFSYKVMSENDGYYKLLTKDTQKHNDTYHDLGIVNCEYPYYFKRMLKTRVNANKYGVLYTTNLFGTEYKLIYVQNESDCFILEDTNIAQDFADDFEKFIKKCDTYCNYENLDVSLLDIEILDADVYPYGISPDIKPVFNYKNTEAYLIEENGIKFIYELYTDTKKGAIYLHYIDEDNFIEWCNNIDALLF